MQNNIGHENTIDNIQEKSTEISARIKQDKKRKKKHHPDETVIKKLDLCYKRLIWYRVHSSRSLVNMSLSAACLLKRFLTKPVFEVLKQRRTKTFHSSLLDVIHVGIEHLDLTGGVIHGAASGGVLAPDPEAYFSFRPILHPIICVLQGTTPEKKQPKEDWDLLLTQHIGETLLDPKCLFVESVAITVSRSIKGQPFLHKMNETHFKRIEKDLKKTFQFITRGQNNQKDASVSNEVDRLAPFSGTYFSFENLPKGLELQLDREGMLFDRNDQGLDTAGAYKYWPKGRGIFLIDNTQDRIKDNQTKKKVFVSRIYDLQLYYLNLSLAGVITVLMLL